MGKLAAYFFGPVAILVGCVMLMMGAKHAGPEASFYKHAAHTTGVVEYAQVNYRSIQDPINPAVAHASGYTLTLRYEVAGQRYWAFWPVSSSSFNAHPVGSSIEVAYYQKDPQYAYPANPAENSWMAQGEKGAGEILIFGGLLLVAGAVLWGRYGPKEPGEDDDEDLPEGYEEEPFDEESPPAKE